jgi:type IV pilus assembly protein PilM
MAASGSSITGGPDNMRKQILAIDPGTYSIKAAIVDSSLRGVRITGLYEFLRRRQCETNGASSPPLEEELSEFIQLIPFRGKRCTLALSSDRLIFRNIRLPFHGKTRDIEKAAGYAIEEEIPFDVEDMVINCLFRDHDRSKGGDLIVIGAEKGIIAKKISIFSGLGIDLKAIGLDASGLLNLGSLLESDPEKTFAIADMGAKKTVVVIIKGGRIEMIRAIPFGGDDVTKAISGHLNIPLLEAERIKKNPELMMVKGPRIMDNCIEGPIEGLARDIELLFDAYQVKLNGRGVETVYLTGGTSSLNGIDYILNRILSIKCIKVNPLHYYPYTLPASQSMEMPQMAISIGLAMAEAMKHKDEVINFRKGEFRPKPKFWERKKGLAIIAGAILLSSLISISDLLIHIYVKQRRLDSIKREIRTLFIEAFPDVKNIVDEPIQMKRLIEDERSKGIHSMFNSSRIIDILREISLRIPSNIRIFLTDLEIDQDWIHIAGEVDSFENIDRVKEMLLQSQFFKDFQLIGAKQNPKTKMIEFRFKMGRKQF